MTVGMDHKSGRKSSWDCKMSIGTMSAGSRHYRRSASSILSTDSDIRFTRKKLSSQYRCGCCIIASFLFLLLLAGAAVYVGYTIFFTQPPEEDVYRASFKVVDGDTFSTEMADPSTDLFKIRSRDYRERLNLLFRRSHIKHGFSGTEILALDGNEGKDLVVHFNVHIDPTYVDVDADELKQLLTKEMALEESLYFRNLTIDSKSLEVIESDAPITSTTVRAVTVKFETITKKYDPPRKCSKLELPYCNKLTYNTTSYPNILGHQTLESVKEDMITFRELVDAECYNSAYDFVCQVLQPNCRKGSKEDEMILPCKSFCRDFISGCGSRLLPKYKSLLDCSNFPEFEGIGSCIPKPNCIREIQARTLTSRICDGVVDCQDLSDERSCTYCPIDHIHCGIGHICIRAIQRCDGRKDCPDGSDERACLSLALNINDLRKNNFVTPHLTRYNDNGYVIFNQRGEVGKLCIENLNTTVSAGRIKEILQTVSTSLCKTLSYRRVRFTQIEVDKENDVSYASMKNPTSKEISFIRSPCSSRQILKISCEDLECGLQITHGSSGIQSLSKMSSHGDWPWHAALFKEDVHLCDGTLVSPEWLVTTSSCFQGQSKAEWIARFGSIRLSSTPPWQQERRIVGMVKSPVEGSTIALTRLEHAVLLSDFVRPICLPKQKFGVKENLIYCNSLGWTKNRDQLQRVQVRITNMNKCENKSISSANSLCTEKAFGQNDCNEEEFAGSPLLCLQPNDSKWSLVGVSNWRIGCSRLGDERPRTYDKISSNVDWIEEIINEIDT